jgi:hypothetical protein
LERLCHLEGYRYAPARQSEYDGVNERAGTEGFRQLTAGLTAVLKLSPRRQHASKSRRLRKNSIGCANS